MFDHLCTNFLIPFALAILAAVTNLQTPEARTEKPDFATVRNLIKKRMVRLKADPTEGTNESCS